MLAQQERSTKPQHVVGQATSTSVAGQLARPNAVKDRLTSKRTRRLVENDEHAAFVSRVIRSYSRRVGDGDVEALALMIDLAAEIDTSIAEAVTRLRACGYSWTEISSRLGITRQAAQQRWGQR
jgi:hypothetical protein